MNRHLLAFGAGLQMTVITLCVTFLGLLGTAFAGQTELANLPLCVVFTTAGVVTVQVSIASVRFGRAPVFSIGTGCGCFGMLLVVLAELSRSFGLLCVAGVPIGIFLATAQYYKVAAVDGVSPSARGQVLAYILGWSLLSAVAGPLATLSTRQFFQPFVSVGPFLAAAIVLAALCVTFSACRPTRIPKPSSKVEQIVDEAEDGSVLRIFLIITACYAVMSSIMTSVPAAALGCGFSVNGAGNLIQLHLVAMFLPSLVMRDQRIFAKPSYLMLAGVSILGGSLLVFSNFKSSLGIAVGLALLGVGWNITFIGATVSMATKRAGRDPRIQGLLDRLVWLSSAVSTVLSGYLVEMGKMDLVILRYSLPLIIVLALAVLREFWSARGCSERQRLGAVGVHAVERAG